MLVADGTKTASIPLGAALVIPVGSAYLVPKPLDVHGYADKRGVVAIAKKSLLRNLIPFTSPVGELAGADHIVPGPVPGVNGKTPILPLFPPNAK